ncbi:unnamed protein product [Rotaria magnacalcarata]|nr:unnamed protein product [Rotaria magnacalcarata]
MFDTEIIGSHALREVCTPLIRIPQPIGTGNMSAIGNDNQGGWFLAEYVTVARNVIENHTRILSTQYLLAVVDRPGYNSKTLWKEILENVTSDNRQRLIWIAPWTGEMRSSTQLRKLVTNVTSDHVTLRQDLRDLVPTSCIDYILEYNIEQWFQ